jgi:hypothetical protein
LLTRARAIQLEEWDKVAAVRAQIAGFAMMFSGKRSNIHVEDFNPHRKAGSVVESSGGSGGGGTPLKQMAAIAKAGAYLPKKLTEEEKSRVWDRLMGAREDERAKRDAIVAMRGEVSDG